MTTGTINEFLSKPEDINPPTPGYFHDVFHMVHAYLELLSRTSETAIPGKGLMKLYSYRLGVLDIDPTAMQLEYMTLIQSDKAQLNKLANFGQSCIAYNIQALYQLLSSTITKDLLRNFGDDKCITAEAVAAINKFAASQDRRTDPRVQLQDNMVSLTETLHYNAIYPRGGITSSQAILRLFDVLDKLIINETPQAITDSRRRITDALRIVFYIGCRYYHLNLIRFSDEIIQRSYDRVLNINDFTLACIPFDPMLIYSCPDNTGSISKWGIEYIQSLEAVLMFMGGVRYSAVLATDANNNQGY